MQGAEAYLGGHPPTACYYWRIWCLNCTLLLLLLLMHTHTHTPVNTAGDRFGCSVRCPHGGCVNHRDRALTSMPYCELNYAVNRHHQSSLHLTPRHDRRPWWSGRSLSHVAYNTIPNCNTAGWSTYVRRVIRTSAAQRGRQHLLHGVHLTHTTAAVAPGTRTNSCLAHLASSIIILIYGETNKRKT